MGRSYLIQTVRLLQCARNGAKPTTAILGMTSACIPNRVVYPRHEPLASLPIPKNVYPESLRCAQDGERFARANYIGEARNAGHEGRGSVRLGW